MIEPLAGWTPFRLAFRDGERAPWVDWCHLGAGRMVEPFHYETILQAMRAPFNLAFQQATPVDALATLPPGVPLAGLIFHMSRCGSTLISQAFAALAANIVVAEATPLRTALRAHAVGRASAAEAALWIRGLVNAYAQPRVPSEARAIVKFMAGDVLDIALVRRAFPDVPWLFVTRDPAEILASQERQGGIDLMRGQIPAARFGLAEETMWAMDALTFKAHVLACFAQAGLDAQVAGGGLVLDYADLPEALWTRVPGHFGVTLTSDDIAAMRGVAERHSKFPREAFAAADDPNRAGAEAFRAIADRIAGPVMAALDAHRRAA